MRHDQKILELQIATRMQSTGQDVDHRHRQHRGASRERAEQRFAAGDRNGARHGAGDAQGRVGSVAGFVRGAVDFDQPGVERSLILGRKILQRRQKNGGHIAGHVADPFAVKTGAAVTPFVRFVGAGAGSGRHLGRGARAIA